jgi:ankyrin repeat protein
LVTRKLLSHGAAVNLEQAGTRFSALSTAALSGQTEVIRLLISFGAAIDHRSCFDQQPLHHAVSSGHVEAVAELLRLGAPIDATDSWGRTVLGIAASCGHVEIIRELLAKGAAINAQDSRRRTALMRAAEDGKPQAVKELMIRGADHGMTEGSGYTARILAAQGGHLLVVRELLAHGANASQADRDKVTALTWARRKCHQDVADFLASYRSGCVISQGASSIGPDDRSSKMDCAKKQARGLVVAGSNAVILLRAPNKMHLASLRRLAVQVVLSAPARLARDRYAHFVRRS